MLSYERDGAIGRLRLNRPEKRNALGPEFWDQMVPTMRRIDADADLRVLVLSGNGKSFSAGADLKSGFDGRPVGGKLQHEYRPVITEVMPNSGAQKAGLKVGDIITKVAGKAVRDRRELQQTMSTFRQGAKAKRPADARRGHRLQE